MLRSFMLISGRGGIVLLRKVLTKTLNQPRLIAGLITALCKRSAGAIALPVSYMQLDNVAITVVESRAEDSEPGAEYLRCVAFHDPSDGELYGRVLATELLSAFMEQYAERLSSMQLANTEGIEEIFKGFSARVRVTVAAAVHPLMVDLERKVGIRHAFLVRHRDEGAFSTGLGSMWYSSSRASDASLIANLQSLLNVSDDLLASRDDSTAVKTAPHTYYSCQEAIASSTAVLEKVFSLIAGLEGSRGVT